MVAPGAASKKARPSRRISTVHSPAGSCVERWTCTGSPSGPLPSTSAARVPEVLRTTRSPSSRKRGSSEKWECTSERSDRWATIMRTESRVMPRRFGRRRCLEGGRQGEGQGLEGWQLARRHGAAPSWRRLGRGEVAGPVTATRTVAHDEIQKGGDDGGWFGSIRDVLTREGRLVHGRAQVARVDRPHGERGTFDGQHGAQVLEAALPAP